MKKVVVIKFFCIVGIIGGMFSGLLSGNIVFSFLFAIVGGWLLMGVPYYGEAWDMLKGGDMGCLLGFLLKPLMLVYGIIYFYPYLSICDWIEDARDKKIRKLRKCIANGDVDAETQYKLGVLYMKTGNNADAKILFKAAIEKGHRIAQSKLTQLEIKIEKKSKHSRKEAKRRAEEDARPKCAYCKRTLYPEDMKYGAVVETPNGPRFYCSRMCKINDGYGGQGY